ncbi:hypothetical protein BDZ89DRAFT_1145749 [Hymenopellis radicata]|nr:hypothetical protein BDZ89DRAFT_1145749 [Hymenopellis radicata]
MEEIRSTGLLSGPHSRWNVTVDVDAQNTAERVIFRRHDVNNSEQPLFLHGDSHESRMKQSLHLDSELLDSLADNHSEYLRQVPCDVSFQMPDQPPLAKPGFLSESEDGVEVQVDDIPPSLLSSMQSSITDCSTAVSDDHHSPPCLSPPIIIKHPHRSVRFRSRVRITSGVHRHIHRSRSDLSTARESDLSSSPSSSISAPLRTRDDEVSSPWGPLGQRVRIMSSRRPRRPSTYQQQVNERTPLVYNHSAPKTPFYGDDDDDFDDNFYASPHTEDADARLNREIDVAFGPWPGRLLNRHWWWWHMEPILCCICIELDESDSEE